MTKSEYSAAYSAARNRAGRLTISTLKELKRTYIEAAKMASEAMRKAELAGLSQLTVQSRAAISAQLERGAKLIRDTIDNIIPDVVRTGSSYISDIDSQYLVDILNGQSVLDFREDLGITSAGIREIMIGVNNRVVAATLNRLWEDGYTLSDRIWRVGSDYREQMNRVISAGFAQGRDVLDIARDMEVYVKDGKQRLARRYGPNLESETKRWMRRIRKNVDYSALRLVRSELYMSLQDSSRESGKANPAATDLYDWILNANRQHWNCECPTLADGSPYPYDVVPSYPHSNCMCRIQPRLRDHDQFIADLKKWANGEQVDYLDDWNREYYSQINAA